MDYKNNFNTANIMNKLTKTYHQFFNNTEVVEDVELNQQFHDLFNNAMRTRQDVLITLNNEQQQAGQVKYVDSTKLVLASNNQQLDFILFQNIFEAEVI